MAERKQVKPTEPNTKITASKDKDKVKKASSRKTPKMVSDRHIKSHIVPVGW